jgi:hypothetical protein
MKKWAVKKAALMIFSLSALMHMATWIKANHTRKERIVRSLVDTYIFNNAQYTCTGRNEGSCLATEISKKFCSREDSLLCKVESRLDFSINQLLDLPLPEYPQHLCCQGRQSDFKAFDGCLQKQDFELHCPFSQQCLFSSDSTSVCVEGENLCFCDVDAWLPCTAMEPTGDDNVVANAIFKPLVFIMVNLVLFVLSYWIGYFAVVLELEAIVGSLLCSGILNVDFEAQGRIGVSIYIAEPYENNESALLITCGMFFILNLQSTLSRLDRFRLTGTKQLVTLHVLKWIVGALLLFQMIVTEQFVGLLSADVNTRQASSSNEPSMPQKAKAKLMQLMVGFDRIARMHGLDYWMAGGTLLGTVRNGGFVPWDDDVDLGATSATVHRLLNDPAVRSTMHADGFGFRYADYIYRFYRLDGSPGYMDVFEYERDPSGKVFRVEGVLGFLGQTYKDIYRLKACPNRLRWPREYLEARELFPLRNLTLNGRAFLAPSAPEPYLDRSFGSLLTRSWPMSWPTGQPGPDLRGKYWRVPVKTHTHDIQWGDDE